MSENKLSFLGGEPPAESAPAPDAPAPEAVVEAAPVTPPDLAASDDSAKGPQRGPDGKFVSTQPVAEVAPQAAPAAPEPVAAAAPVADPSSEVKGVLAGMLDERDRRQKAEAEAADLRKRLAALEAPKADAKPVARPDFDENPKGHIEARDADVEQRLYTQNREFSRRWAVKEYGAETVEQAHEWAKAKCDTDPHFNSQVLSSDDPYEFAIQSWKRDRMLTQVSPDDLDDYLAWKAAKAAAPADAPIAPVAAATPPPSAPAPPPRSIATQPSAGGMAVVPTGPGQAHSALFHG